MAVVKSISSRENPLLRRVRKLVFDPPAYRKFGAVWIEGEHLCGAFLQHGGTPPQALIGESAWAEPALRAVADRADAVAVLPDALMGSLSTLESPALLGFVVPWAGASAISPGEPSLVLDRLQDAGNVGTILRSAAAFGFTQIVAIRGTAALWSTKVLRAGMGAHFALRLVEGSEEASLAELGLPLLATSSHAGRALHDTELPWPCAWMFGHEGQGVSAALLRRATRTLRIVQPGGEESLNVAAAVAICCYESVRQRLARG